jgi:hypothetical protein
MCLQSITKHYDVPTTNVRRAYKILNGLGATPFKKTLVPENVWLKSQTNEIWSWGPYVRYPSGFHVYPTRREARQALKYFKGNRSGRKEWHIATVEVRGVHTEGLDGTSSLPTFINMKLRNLVSYEMRLINGRTK